MADTAILEALGLNPGIQALAYAYAGQGSAQRLIAVKLSRKNEGDEQPEVVRNAYLRAGHNLANGAATFALFDAPTAKLEYSAASWCFMMARMPSGAALVPCSMNMAAASDWQGQLTLSAAASPSDAVGLLLYDSWMRAVGQRPDLPSWLYARVKEFEGGRVGAMRIPFRVFAEFHRNMLDFAPSGKPGDYILDPVVALLERYAEAVELAQSDRYHWERMQTRMRPVPHEILAAILSLLEAARTDVENELRERLRSKAGIALLKVAHEILHAPEAESTEFIVNPMEEQNRSDYEPPTLQM